MSSYHLWFCHKLSIKLQRNLFVKWGGWLLHSSYLSWLASILKSVNKKRPENIFPYLVKQSCLCSLGHFQLEKMGSQERNVCNLVGWFPLSRDLRETKSHWDLIKWNPKPVVSPAGHWMRNEWWYLIWWHTLVTVPGTWLFYWFDDGQIALCPPFISIREYNKKLLKHSNITRI